jgi:hypothetical protein
MDPPSSTTTSSSSDNNNNNNNNSRSFPHLRQRLTDLHLWHELAIRPAVVDAEDEDLLANDDDEQCGKAFLDRLHARARHVRRLLNEHLPIVPGPLDAHLQPRPSGLGPAAGLGLFYEGQTSLAEGDFLCYYYGHIHNFQSARDELTDTSYLMNVAGDLLVDTGPLPQIRARYINDPLNDVHVNCRFVPDPTHLRSTVVATRAIQSGQELFAAYGDAYWSQHATVGRMLK